MRSGRHGICARRAGHVCVLHASFGGGGGNACAKNRQECGACTLASVRLLSVDVPAAVFADTGCSADEFLGVMAARTSDSESVCVARRLEGYENQKEAVHLEFFQQRCGPVPKKTTC